MKNTFFLTLAALLVASPALAQTGGQQQYISDEISVSIREAPRNDAPALGIIKSGARVTVLETLGAESFARIRTSDGRTGWITARFLTAQPAAATRLTQTREELDAAKLQLRNLESELAAAKSQLSKARPAFELSQENERLQAAIGEHERTAADLQLRYDAARQQRKTLLTGASLLSGGVILGLLLPWLLRSGRRRRSDF